MSITENETLLSKVVAENARLKNENTGLSKRCQEFSELIPSLQNSQEELRQIITQLRAPPWHPAIFMERINIDPCPMALVAINAMRRCVRIDETVDMDNLATGDVVLLNNELNVVLGSAPDETAREGELATVERWTPEGRLILRDRDMEVIVRTAGSLRRTELRPGDQVRWDRNVSMAFERIEATGNNAANLEEISGNGPQRLGGLEHVVESVLARFTLSVVNPELAEHYLLGGNKSLLMVGPPGCGKTSLMRRIAAELSRLTGSRCKVAAVNGAELESPWVGETQRNIKRLVRELNAYAAPALLFIDEIEAIGRVRGSAVGHHSDKFLSSWLAELDGLQSRSGVAIVAATNRKDLLDQALFERIAGMEVHIGRPNMEAARAIFAVHLPETLPYWPNGPAATATREELIEAAVAWLYSPNADNEIAKLRFRDGQSRTVLARELASGRLFAQICEVARQAAFERHAGGGEAGISHRDMAYAVAEKIDNPRTTLSPRNVRGYLVDLPDDVDVIAVDPVRRKVRQHHYLNG
jgi:ATP-dependent 26S proteasome regulatory subunit